MKKVLVYYGVHEDWKNIYDKNQLMNFLNDIIYDVKIFKDIPSLKTYLYGDGRNYKNYILPSRIHHIHELNDAKINSLFDIKCEYLKILSDKKTFADYVTENNLNKYVPKYFNKSSNRNSDKLVILKPRDSCFSIGVYTKKLCNVKDFEFDDNVVQKYIFDSKEYAGYFVSYNGKITHAFAYLGNYGNGEFIKNNQGMYMDVSQVKVKLYLNSKLVKAFESFLKPCSYTGISCFDFKIKDKHLYIFEINPRIGGSLNRNMKDFTNMIRNLIHIYDDRNVYN